jgi:hypothetical protein
MPRFRIKSLLVLFAVVGLWLSTATDYPGSKDIRAVILLLIFLTAGFAALFYRGRRQAFWIGFFATMLIMAAGLPGEFVPRFIWIGDLWTRYTGTFDPNDPQYYHLLRTIQPLAMFVLSAINGCIAVYVFDCSRSEK